MAARMKSVNDVPDSRICHALCEVVAASSSLNILAEVTSVIVDDDVDVHASLEHVCQESVALPQTFSPQKLREVHHEAAWSAGHKPPS